MGGNLFRFFVHIVGNHILSAMKSQRLKLSTFYLFDERISSIFPFRLLGCFLDNMLFSIIRIGQEVKLVDFVRFKHYIIQS